jgi:hypothetical protein
MKPKEIHDLLLSLLVRGLGFWLLYQFWDNFIGLVEMILDSFSPTASDHRTAYQITYNFVEFAAKIGVAAYLILGAPPFLKWATRKRD